MPEPPPDYEKASAEHGAAPSNPPTAPPRPRGPLPLKLPILDHLKSHRVILASASPRRRALLAQIGLADLEIIPSTLPEDIDKTTHDPHEYVAATARQKCLSVYQAALEAEAAATNLGITSSSSSPRAAAATAAAGPDAAKPPDTRDPTLVIAADTVIVTRDGRVLEKPRSEAEHVRMLRHLRDTTYHRVLTSICVLSPREDAQHPGYAIAAHTEETKVYFASELDGLPDDVIEAYVRTREGADKAGGYAVQGVGGMVLVEKVEGGVDNVVGLPVRKTLALAEKVIFRQDEVDGEGDSEESDGDDGEIAL